MRKPQLCAGTALSAQTTRVEAKLFSPINSVSSPKKRSTHKHPRISKWLQRHPRFHMHYTPTSSSWMNLAGAIITFLTARNNNPRRYVWKAKGEEILRKIDAARRALNAQRNPISETSH
jgi:hypothetical protein